MKLLHSDIYPGNEAEESSTRSSLAKRECLFQGFLFILLLTTVLFLLLIFSFTTPALAAPSSNSPVKSLYNEVNNPEFLAPQATPTPYIQPFITPPAPPPTDVRLMRATIGVAAFSVLVVLIGLGLGLRRT